MFCEDIAICDCLSKNQTCSHSYKLNFILLPQLIATLLITMQVHYLHWLMSTGLFFYSGFCRPWKSMTSEMAPIARWLWYGSGYLTRLPLSVLVCLGIVVEYWPFVGIYGHHKHTKLLFVSSCFFDLAFATIHTSPVKLPNNPLYTAAQY